MTPESVADTIRRHGETVTFRRPLGTAPQTYADADVKAKVRLYTPQEIVAGNGLLVQGDRQVIAPAIDLAAAGWPVPPKQGDFVVIDGRAVAVQGSETRKIGEDPARYDVRVRG